MDPRDINQNYNEKMKAFEVEMVEEALKRNEGIVSHLGPLVVRTGQYTGFALGYLPT